MSLRVNLVVMLVAVICVRKALQVRPIFLANDDSEADEPDTHPSIFITPEEAHSIIKNCDRSQNGKFQNRGFFDEATDAFEDAKSAIQRVHTYVKQAVEPRRRHKSNRRMMAMLMALKMKLMALIPIMIGGMILLSSTTALAGFFFALFAAVLGLRAK